MNKYYLLILSFFFILILNSCSEKEKSCQVEFVVENDNIKHAIDSLILLEENKGLIQELCVDFNGIGYRLTLVSRKVSYQEELGTPFLFYLSNNKTRINIYSGIEKMLQPIDKERNISNSEIKINDDAIPSYWVIDIDYENNYKITKVMQDLPFVGYQENDIIESD
jgi:uncharacterized membrane protein